MSEVSHLISMEDKFSSLFVGKCHVTRNQVFFYRYPNDYLSVFIPYKNASFSDAFHSLTEIMFIWGLSFALIEIALCLFLFDFSNVDPSVSISADISIAKNIILKHFFMLAFGGNGIESAGLLDSTFLAIVTEMWIDIFKNRSCR